MRQWNEHVGLFLGKDITEEEIINYYKPSKVRFLEEGWFFTADYDCSRVSIVLSNINEIKEVYRG